MEYCGKANTAKEESKKAEYKEILELIGNGIRPEKVIENLSTEKFMDKYQEAIENEKNKGGILKEATVERKSAEKIWVTTKEGWVYEITENKVELIGQKGKNPPPDLTTADINFIIDPAGYTSGNVTVEIELNKNIEGFTLQYSKDKDGKNWTDYTTGEKILYTDNGMIHARLINSLEEIGGTASKPINTIDREKPNQATISYSSTTTDTETSITATVTQTDKGSSGSGVDFKNSKWKFSTESGEIGIDPSSYTGGSFSKSPEVITLNPTTPGTYYLHVLTVDKAGNKIEKVQGSVTVTKPQAKVGEIVIGENKEYTKNGTAIIPVGFAIKPGCDDIANGLVISDVANDTNDTGNQFVWIPVTDMSHYVRDMTFPIAQCYNGSETYSRGSGYLPSGISDEDATIRTAKGFYLARYETGSGIVSKKGASPIYGLTYEETKTQAKSFINTKYVKSSVVSGSQWDYTMWLLNGKKDAMNGTFNVRVKNLNRQPNYSEGVTGNNRHDLVYNLYDIEGNYDEMSSETATTNGIFLVVVRGGSNNNSSNVNCASCRKCWQDWRNNGTTYRMVLYVTV